MPELIALRVSDELNKAILQKKKICGYTTRQEVIKHILINQLKPEK